MSDNEGPAPRRGRLAVRLIVIITVLVVVTTGGVFVWKYVVGGLAATDTRVKTYDKPITRLELKGDSGMVDIAASGGKKTTVETRMEWSGDGKPGTTHEWSGKTLSLTETGCRGGGLFGSRCEVDYRVEVPSGVEVDVTVDSGVIETSGIKGDQRLETDSGTIDVTDPGAKLTLKSDSGTIDGHDLESTEVMASVDSGTIDLSFFKAPSSVTVTNDSGPVTVALPYDGEGYDVHADTDSGSRTVDVRDDASSKRTIKVTTTHGPVTVEYS